VDPYEGEGDGGDVFERGGEALGPDYKVSVAYYLCGYFSYALLAVVYVSYVEDIFLNSPCL
jgi:hypothetical protein